MIYFTSDTHFGHTNIIKYCKRPFTNVEEMDDIIVQNWNSVVSDTDTVYHLGDLTLGDNAQEYLQHLNGNIKILSYTYHHDKYWLNKELGKMLLSKNGEVSRLSGLEVLDFSAIYFGVNSKYKHSITMCHYEMRNWDRKHYNSWHLFGHDHRVENHFNGDFSMNVGVDANNFTPVSMEEITEYMLSYGWSI